MARYRYDKDLECLIEIREESNYFENTPRGPAIISDIEPYRAVASDVACDGRRPVIGGRRQHREFLSRNGLVEVGNETKPTRSNMPSARELERSRVEDIKRAAGEYGSNTGADAAAWHMRNNNGR
jgi:hypothetical protein